MKSKSIALTTMIASLVAAQAAHAVAPGEGGGGGEVVVTPNGTTFADQYATTTPYYIEETNRAIRDAIAGGEEFHLSQDVLDELDLNAQILGTSDKRNCDPTATDMAFSAGIPRPRVIRDRLIDEQVLDSNIHYYFVEHIPNIPNPYSGANICDQKVVTSGIPQNGSIIQVACTIGNNTWVVKNLYNDPTFSASDKSVLFVHEGMRRTRDQRSIGLITKGLQFANRRLHAQLEGDRTPLNDAEKDMMLTMAMALRDRGLEDELAQAGSATIREISAKDDLFVTNGGGFASGFAKIDPTAFIGIGVGIGTNPLWESIQEMSRKVNAHATLIATNFCHALDCEIGENATIIGSTFIDGIRSRVGRGAQIEFSVVPSIVAAETHVSRSQLLLDSLQPLQGDATNSEIVDSVITRDKLQSGQLVIADHVLIENSKIELQGALVLHPNSSISHFNGRFDGYNDEARIAWVFTVAAGGIVLGPVVGPGVAIAGAVGTVAESTEAYSDKAVSHLGFHILGIRLDGSDGDICAMGNHFKRNAWAVTAAQIHDREDLKKYCAK